jgi:thiol-disulfide isomerase/thioredoxin
MQSSRRRLVLLLLCGLAIATATAKPIPDLKFQDLAGHKQSLASLRGSITVLNFWATWCTPCRQELPRLSTLNAQYAGKGVRFIAVSVDEPKDRAKIEPLLREQHIALDAWVGADIDTLGRLGLGNVVPATIVLDQQGETVGRILGEARDADVTAYLDWLLHDRKDAAPPAVLKRY